MKTKKKNKTKSLNNVASTLRTTRRTSTQSITKHVPYTCDAREDCDSPDATTHGKNAVFQETVLRDDMKLALQHPPQSPNFGKYLSRFKITTTI